MENNIPTSLYIHIPWCVKKCPYCDFNSYASKHIPEDDYLEALIKDLQQSNFHKQFHSIFIGGGTPTLLSAGFYQKLFEVIQPAANTEITIEANPDTVNLAKLEALLASGINRISIGIQSFQDDKLKALGRIHDAQTAITAVKTAQDAGFENINLDLMFGLPEQTLDDALFDLETAINLQPTHISWYQLTIEPKTAFYKQTPTLPAETSILTIWRHGQKLLKSSGYKQYEISAYCKNNNYCQHNLNYWKFGDYLGIGAGAHGKITTENQSIRTAKTSNPQKYMQNSCGSSNKLAQHELILEFMLNALRLYQPIPARLFIERTGIPISTITDQLNEAQTQGLLKWNKKQITTTAKGKRMLNNLLEIFA